MATMADQFSRVLGALEDLAAQEALLIHAQNYVEVATVQERMAPLIRFLIEGVAAADAALRDRIAALVARRDRMQQYLAAEVEKKRKEMAQLELSRRRIAQVAPAYGLREAAAGVPRLSVRS